MRSSDLTVVDTTPPVPARTFLEQQMLDLAIASHDPGNRRSGFPWPSGGPLPFVNVGGFATEGSRSFLTVR